MKLGDRGRRAALWLSVLLPILLVPPPPRASSSDDCLLCHADRSLTTERKGKTISLHVDRAALARSPHKDLECSDCHAGIDPGNVPHAARIAPINCMSCHGDAAEKHPFHSQMSKATGTDGLPGTSCKQCHGTHDVTAVASPDSKFQPSNLPRTCGGCHDAVARQYVSSAHGRSFASGVAGAPDCISCHNQPITLARSSGSAAELKLAQEKICLSCHLDNPDVRARVGPQAGFIAAFERSVHGAALLKGNGEAATCINCHGSHEMKPGMDPSSRVSKQHIPGTCAGCHDDIAREYADSVHAAAIGKGNIEAPVCTDCHGEHNILTHTDPNAPVAAANVSAQVCSPCHSSVKLSQKYGIASDRFRTFSDSYHGLALHGGSVEAANCASCHGAHAIKASKDPDSRVNKANLAKTCGQCHPGANERFAVGSVHVRMTQAESPILYWIATIYIGLIVIVVGGMLVHNLLDFIRKSVRRFKIRTGVISSEPPGAAEYLRMTGSERIQHGALMLSFTVLVVTGFMLRYPDAWWVVTIRRLSGNVFELRSLMHRIAAVVMTAASVYHVAYVAFTIRGRQLVRDLLPSFRDGTEAVGMVLYNLGLSRRKPEFGRFSYIEKAEYWALVWGTIVMVATGAIMWFENRSIGLLTKLGWDIARTIHFYEAWLATLAILLWHIYYVVFNPDVYPMSLAWLTGRLTEAEMAEEHPRELTALKTKEEEAEPEREAS